MSVFTRHSGPSLLTTISMYNNQQINFEMTFLCSFDFLIFVILKQVKNEWLHNAGAGVVAHVADSLKLQEMQQDTNSFIAASL